MWKYSGSRNEVGEVRTCDTSVDIAVELVGVGGKKPRVDDAVEVSVSLLNDDEVAAADEEDEDDFFAALVYTCKRSS
jgi:hypothetical protein